MVTKVFLLAGQSNMSGRGVVEAQDLLPHPRVMVLGKEGRWMPAKDPLHWDKPEMIGVGPGLTFGKTIADAWPGTTIGLVPAAFGGTSIQQWQKGSEDPLKLYETAVARARTAMRDAPLAGIIWHQGEANLSQHPAEYAQLFAKLFSDLRGDLAHAPIVAGEIGTFVDGSQPFNAALHLLPKRVSCLAVASAEGLSDKGDKLHFDSPSARELGRRYAKAFLQLDR